MSAHQNARKTRPYATKLLPFLVILACTASTSVNAGLYLNADGRTDAYLLIHEAFGGRSYEVPDCAHSKFGPHITQRYDSELKEPVFAFHLHIEFDNDRCIIFDRQRTEITTFRLTAKENDIRTYQWRFKLDEDFIPSTYFNHIFQIRPIDPVPSGNPIFTISTLSGETEELIFYQDRGNGMKVLHRMPLADFKGRWIDVRVRAKFSSSGFIEVQLKSTLDGVVLLEWRQDPINLWPWDSIFYSLPKWGNYRSLENTIPLRDEVVLYNDFCVAKEGESCEKLALLDKFRHPARFHFPDEFSIDPFPTGQALQNHSVLRFLQNGMTPADNRRSSARLANDGHMSEENIDERRDLNDTPIIACNNIGKWRAELNPFARPAGCTARGKSACGGENRPFQRWQNLRDDDPGILCKRIPRTYEQIRDLP